MKKSLRVIFFGNEQLATGTEPDALVFNALLKSSHKIVGLVVHSSKNSGRKKRQEPIIELAEQHNIPVFNPADLMDIGDQLLDLAADCGVLVAYGKIIPEDIINIFPKGIINLHPSLLPKLRGPTPIETALLENVQKTGVSIMKLIPKMDAGPVYKQIEYQIREGSTKATITNELHLIGSTEITAVLDQLVDDSAQPKVQNSDNATFSKLIKKSDGELDFTKPADVLIREINAYSGWPGSYFVHNNQVYVVHKAELVDIKLTDDIGSIVVSNTSLYIKTSSGVLSILSIQPSSKKIMSIINFLNGYRGRF